MKPLAVLAATLAMAATAPVAAADDMTPRLVRTIADRQLGNVLATGTRQAIYTWNRERDGRVRCTGTCAEAWPPVVVKAGTVVPMHVRGIMGDFGTVRRPDGTRQLTLDRRPLYTYAHEGPGEVKCNNVAGWFAVKVHT